MWIVRFLQTYHLTPQFFTTYTAGDCWFIIDLRCNIPFDNAIFTTYIYIVGNWWFRINLLCTNPFGTTVLLYKVYWLEVVVYCWFTGTVLYRLTLRPWRLYEAIFCGFSFNGDCNRKFPIALCNGQHFTFGFGHLRHSLSKFQNFRFFFFIWEEEHWSPFYRAMRSIFNLKVHGFPHVCNGQRFQRTRRPNLQTNSVSVYSYTII